MPARVLLTAIVVLLVAGGAELAGSPEPPEDGSACERETQELWDDPRWQTADWSKLYLDARRLIEAHPGVARCTARLRYMEADALESEGHYIALDSAQADFFDGGYADVAAPSDLAEQLRIRGRNDERLGRIGDSAARFFRAALLADSLTQIKASLAYLDAAISAMSVGRPDLHDAYLNAGEALLTDSLRAATSDAGRHALSIWGSYQYERAGALYLGAKTSADSVMRARLLSQALDENGRALLAISRADRVKDGGERAAVLEQRAQIALARGDLAEAKRAIAEASVWLAAEWGEQPEAELEQAIIVGDIAASERDYPAAIRAYTDAQQKAVAYGLVTQEIDALVARGRLEESRKRFAFAERAFRSAVALQESSRERTGLREWTASAFAHRQVAHRGLARVLLAQGDVRGSLAALDATRARAYQDLRRFRERHRALTGVRRRRVDALVDSLGSVRRQITRSRADADRTLGLQHALVAYQDSLSKALGVKPLAATPLDVPRLQTHLATNGREVVAYSLDGVASTAYVITADTVVAVSLPADRDAITRAASRLLAPWLGDAPDPAADLDAAHELYRAVVAPVEPLLSPGSRLTVVPDGALAHVPFGMLVRAPAESYDEADYVLQHRAVTVELAAGLVAQPTATPSGRRVVAFGRSTFAGPQARVRGDALGSLPFVAEELRNVGRHAARSIVALNDDATEASLTALAPTANVVHVASHAVSDPELPMNGRILLTGDSQDDGDVHLYELQNRDLAADLVVLSGCSTAAGELHAGEGLVGLGYGVRVAGAAASIATLWAVDDRATVFLMDALYGGLADGLSKDEALRNAQIAYLAEHAGLEASPFYWAAPILSGTPVPVPLGAPTRWWLWALGLGLAGALAWRLTRRTA